MASRSAKLAICYKPELEQRDGPLDKIDWDKRTPQSEGDRAIGYYTDDWTHNKDRISVKLIGTAADGMFEGQQIIASFNAG